MAENTRLEELIPLYALGVLEGDELREAERLIRRGLASRKGAVEAIRKCDLPPAVFGG